MRLPPLFALALAWPLALDAAPPPTAADRALQNFARWDADADSLLTLAEIDRAIASPDVKGADAAAAVALRRIAQNRKAPVESFTRESLLAAAAGLRFADSRDEEENPDIARADPRPNFERYQAAALRKIESSSRELFVGPPRLDGFVQGRLGSCFSLAPLTAVVHAAPDSLPARFAVSPADGAITVTFGESLAITVPALTDGEIALGTVTGDGGLWAVAYEKAVGELRRRSFPAEHPRASATPLATVTRGGSAGTMLSVLTGRAITRFTCRHWLPASTMPEPERAQKLDELRALLCAATEEGRLMTAGTSLKTRKVPSLSQNHAYAVLGYDSATDLVTLRDPHGQNFTPKGPAGLEHGYEVRHGVFRVPVAEVVRLMAGFAFQQTTPVAHRGYPGGGTPDTPDPAS